jgi:hypothetical protein
LPRRRRVASTDALDVVLVAALLPGRVHVYVSMAGDARAHAAVRRRRTLVGFTRASCNSGASSRCLGARTAQPRRSHTERFAQQRLGAARRRYWLACLFVSVPLIWGTSCCADALAMTSRQRHVTCPLNVARAPWA